MVEIAVFERGDGVEFDDGRTQFVHFFRERGAEEGECRTAERRVDDSADFLGTASW